MACSKDRNSGVRLQCAVGKVPECSPGGGGPYGGGRGGGDGLGGERLGGGRGGGGVGGSGGAVGGGVPASEVRGESGHVLTKT
jgi:hypothetical protein